MPSWPAKSYAAVATHSRPSLSKASAAAVLRPRAYTEAWRPDGPWRPSPMLTSPGVGEALTAPPHAVTSAHSTASIERHRRRHRFATLAPSVLSALLEHSQPGARV